MVIDFHTHIFPERIASSTVHALAERASITPHTDATAASLLSHMHAAGVDLAINLPVLTRPQQFDSVTAFAKTLREREDTRDRILSFAGIHPAMEDAVERLHELREAGFCGIKIHPDYQNTYIDDPAYVRILGCAKALGLITVTHAGIDGAYIGEPVKCTPTRVLRLLDRIGGYDRLVLAHLGGNEMLSDVIKQLASEAIYFDTAYSLRQAGTDGFAHLLDRHGDERILFGTDSPWRDMREELSLLERYVPSAASRERILSGNARQLLGV